MEGIKEYASVFFDSKPVRIAKPKELDGLFENLRSPEYACAVGLIMHTAGGYTPYEVDVNKRVRHSNENIVEKKSANLKEEITLEKNQNDKHPFSLDEEKKETNIVNITEKSKQNDMNKPLSKFWNWATQLF